MALTILQMVDSVQHIDVMGGVQSAMNLSYEPDPQIADGLVVRLSGNLDITGAAKLWDDVSDRAGEETRFFIFDLTDVPIVTSAGIGTLVRFLVRLRAHGGAVAICGCSNKIREIFSIVMLDDILQVSDTEDEAREKLAH
jgi:anti-anti-sigma factor